MLLLCIKRFCIQCYHKVIECSLFIDIRKLLFLSYMLIGKIISKVLEFLQIVVDESYVAYKYADDKRRTANGQIILNIARCGIPEDIAKTLSSKEWKIHRQRLAIYGNISFLHIYDVYLKKEIILQTKEPNKSKVPYECFREYSIETKEQRRKNFETY